MYISIAVWTCKEIEIEKLIAENPSLLVWDNFETVLQNADAKDKKSLLDFLKKLPERSKALVTSRRTRLGVMPLTKGKTVDLDILNPLDAEALTWLHAELVDATNKLRTEQEKLPMFLNAVGYHPLGISLAIPQLSLRNWTLTELIRALQDSVESLALDEELYDDPDVPERLKKVAASFELTYNILSDDARTILPKLAATFPGGMWDFTVLLILEIDEAAWSEVTRELNTHNLLTRRPVVIEHLGRLASIWHLHPLLRTYAVAKLENSDVWCRGVAGKYWAIAEQISLQFRCPHAPQMLAFLRLEEANLLHWLTYCEVGNHWELSAQLIECLHYYYKIRGRWRDQKWILLRGIAIAKSQSHGNTNNEIRRKGSIIMMMIFTLHQPEDTGASNQP